MKRAILAMMMAAVPMGVFAADGQVLINQATVIAGGGFPYNITQPGSYKLSGNLTVANANTTAIVVAADNVTIDLNGFSIIGPCATSSACVSGTGVGVSSANENPCSSAGPVQGGYKNVGVINGTIRGTGAGGVRLGNSAHVENLTVQSSGRFGIATGDFSLIKDNRIRDTRQENTCNFVVGGILPGGGSVVSGNTISGSYIGLEPYYGTSIPIPSVLLIGNVSVGNTYNGVDFDAAVSVNNIVP